MKVDIVIPTRDKENILNGLLNQLRSSKIAGQIIIAEERPLSLARKKACLRANTEWVAMIDDDMIIPHSWFESVVEQIDDTIGAVSTVAIDANPDLQAYQFIVNSILPLEEVDTLPHINNILIRRRLMENYEPPGLFLSEDFFLRKHVIKSGYKWKVIGKIGVVHAGRSKSKVEIAMAYKRYGHYNLYQLLRRFVSRLLLSPFAALVTHDGQTLANLWRENVEFSAGWLKETFN